MPAREHGAADRVRLQASLGLRQCSGMTPGGGRERRFYARHTRVVDHRAPASVCEQSGQLGYLLGMDFAERAARNESVFRDVNERIEQGAEMHSIETVERFHCECDQEGCFERVRMRPDEYRAVLERRYCFVTVPAHADPRVERVVERCDDFWIVEKIGEAREALDRRHPQEHHSDDT